MSEKRRAATILSHDLCKQQVLDALSAVQDPEIDESIGSLSFVVDTVITGGDVEVVIRLPTFWCPSNFVFLIAEDMRAAVLRLDWVQNFKLKVLDHFAGNDIATGINQGRPFESIFPNQAGNTIDKLRKEFDSKAFLMRQRNLILALQKRGVAATTLLTMTIDQARSHLTTDEEQKLFTAYLEKRQAAGIRPETHYLVSDSSGCPVSDLNAHLREIRMIATNAASNGEMCRMLVAARQQISCSTVPIKRYPKSIISEEAKR